MRNRIEQLIKDKGLTSVKFAETIGVQASSISHVVSGRSKPSFDFMEKIKNKFPEINMNWLISGEGEMYNYGNRDMLNFEAKEEKNTSNFYREEEVKKQEQQTQVPHELFYTNNDKTKVIERVVVFFTDKTLKEYKPY